MSTRTYLIGQGYDNLRKHGGKTFSTMLIICATMFILGLFIILFMNIESNVKAVAGSQGLQAFISDDVADSEIEELAGKLTGISNVKNLKYIDKNAALEDAKDTLKDYEYLLEGMEETNPFPRSFIITFEKLENTQGVKQAIESVDGIYKVSYNQKIVDTVITISQIGNYAIICVGIVMMVISIFIISNTIKLAVYSNKREIYIMKYLGATPKFIKYPFVVEGILMGLASAIISWIIVSLTYSTAYIYLPKVGAELGVFGFIGYSQMWYITLVAFLILGVFLGGVGSSFATRKYLKEFRPIKVLDNKKNIKNKNKQEKNAAKREKARQKEEIKLKRQNLKQEAKEKQEQDKKSKQDFERKRKARRLSILFLALIISSSFATIFAESTKDKIDAIDKETSAAAKRYEQVQADIEVYEKEINSLDVEVQKYEQEVNNLSDKVTVAKAEVDEISAKLQDVSSNYEATEQLLNTRLRALYENGFVNIWEVLFSAESVTDFFAKYNVLATIIENDRKNLQDMNEQKRYIQNLKETAELKRLQIEQAEYDVQKSKEALESAKLNKTNKLNQLEVSKSELKTMIANLKKERAKQEKILAAEIAAAQGSNIKFSGEFTWPTPGAYYISAMFRDKEYYQWSGSVHKGTDIAKSGGCNIVAAQTGTVIVASGNGAYNGGYGNYVVIDHGTKDGVRYTTVYAHMKSVSVKKGDTVVKGQKIGYMGSTGWSTGTHLHFEIRRNNVQINAMQYYPELKGTATYYSYGRWVSYPFGNESKYQI